MVVVCGLIVAAYLVSGSSAKEASRPKIRSIAVLPLKNLSGDPAQDYLADGMTDALIGRLAEIRDLRVTSYTSAARFKDAKMSVPDISKTLGVDALVEGPVIREGNRIRVTAQLIRGATDEHSAYMQQIFIICLQPADFTNMSNLLISGRLEIPIQGIRITVMLGPLGSKASKSCRVFCETHTILWLRARPLRIQRWSLLPDHRVGFCGNWPSAERMARAS